MKSTLKQATDPGLGTSYKHSVTRLLKEDGSFNIQRIGTVTGYKDFYKYLVDLPVWKFVLFLMGSFTILNSLFALLYVIVGVSQLSGVQPGQHPFVAAFYFSAQTFSTVGYGAISPQGNTASLLAAIEAFFGLITFSIATGLIYGRFSRPSAKIAFTHNVIISPYKDGHALMFKMVNQRNSVLLNTKVHLLISLVHEDHEQNTFLRKYYDLPLEVDFVRYFPLTWTIVHPINEESPLYGKRLEEIKSQGAEILILVEAFDETFSQTVVQKHSYAGDQWLTNVRFKRNFGANEEGTIVLNIQDLNEVEMII